MFKKNRLTVLSFAVLLALLMAAVMPLSALAQDGTPPQPEAPVVDEPVVDEPIVDEPAVEESVVEEPAEDLTVSEVLEQLPEDTALVVVDEEGEALPLASVEAAEVLAAPDPYFTVAGVTYQFTAADCDPGGAVTACANPIQAAIDYLSTTLHATPTDGNVYVEAGTYTENVSVDGSAWTTAGGTTPLSLGIIGAGSDSTTLNGMFYITGMNAFTLSGFSVNTNGGFNNSIDVSNGNGVLQLTDLDVTNTNEESNGIRVDNHTGNVNLTEVNATTMGTGIYINVLSGDVTLDDVAAAGNSFDGASIGTEDGNITVNNGDFSNNGYNGGYIDAGSGNITVNGGDFSGNGDTGLYLSLTVSGNVTLNNVTATGNGVNGAFVDGGTLLLKTGIHTITSVGSSGVNTDVLCGNYSDNGEYGLMLDTGGNTYLGGPILSGNGLGEYNLVSGTVSFGLCDKLALDEEGGERGFKPQNNLSGEPPVCNGEKKVVLKTGDAFGEYENLCDVDFQLQEVTEDNLPGALPSGATQLGSLDALVTSGGNAQGELPVGGKITLKFPIPDGVGEASLVVLFWNGAEWVEVPGGEVIDGFFVVTVNKPGNYVLIAQ